MRPQFDEHIPFPALIDNTMRSDFLSCPTKWFWSFVYKIGPNFPSVHLHAGGSFAAGLEATRKAFYQDGLSAEESKRIGLNRLIEFYGDAEFPETKTGDKSLDNVIRAFDSYFERYDLATDPIKPFISSSGKAMVEFTFSLPMEIAHPETGDPILYGGRSDMIGVMHDTLYVTDEKTASQLGAQWAGQWELDSQMTGYCKAGQAFGIPVVGALIRGIGLLKTKISHSEVIIYRPQWVIDRWWEQLHRDVGRMVSSWKEGFYDMALKKDACGAYGGCPFIKLCNSQSPAQWIPIHYMSKNWDPLAKDFGEKLLDQVHSSGADGFEGLVLK